LYVSHSSGRLCSLFSCLRLSICMCATTFPKICRSPIYSLCTPPFPLYSILIALILRTPLP
jgi:hypothetical protein